MKALKFVKTQDYQVVDIPEPVQDGEHVIIDVEAVGLCGSDIEIWKGSKVFPSGIIIGHEFCGTVTDPGPRSDLAVGDRVVGIPLNYCGKCSFCQQKKENLCSQTIQKGGPGVSVDGACTPKFAITAGMALKTRKDVDPKALAFAEPLSGTHHATVTIGKVKKDEKVLVIGGGLIGLLCAWWSMHQGAYTVISEVNPDRIAHIKKTNAANDVLDPTADGELDKFVEKTGGGFDVCIVCAPPNDALYNGAVLKMTAKGGRIVQMTCYEGLVALNFFAMQYKELSLAFSWSETEEDFKEALKAAETYPDDFLAHVTKVIPMDQVQEQAVMTVEHRTNDVKVMIDPNL